MRMRWKDDNSLMRIFLICGFFLLAGCSAYVPMGEYKMKDSPKTELVVCPNNKFQFVLDYQNPYINAHIIPEQYYFRTDGTWKILGRDLVLNSTDDSMQYKLSKVTVMDGVEKDSSYYTFYDIFNERIPILKVKHADGYIEEMNDSLQYSMPRNSKDTLQFYFFGYKPVTLYSSGESGKDYIVFVMPEYRPAWIKDMHLRIKKIRKHGTRTVTLNWNYMQERLKQETNKKYASPPMF